MINSWALSSKDGIDGMDFDGKSEAAETTGTVLFVFVRVRPIAGGWRWRTAIFTLKRQRHVRVRRLFPTSIILWTKPAGHWSQQCHVIAYCRQSTTEHDRPCPKRAYRIRRSSLP